MRPSGYPFLVFILAKVGIGNSSAFIGLNCLFLATGCYAAYLIARRSYGLSGPEAQCTVLLTTLSFVFIRNVAYPLSDICFFGTSMLCLLLMTRAEATVMPNRLLYLTCAVPVLLMSIELRTIGIALIPAFVWSALGGIEGCRGLTRKSHRVKASLLIGVAIIVVTSTLSLPYSRYFKFNAKIFQHRGLVRSILSNAGYQSLEWGQLVTNIPLSKLPSAMEFPLRTLGGIVVLLWVSGMWLERRKANTGWIYVAAYACIVFGYPWDDARLWLPVIPLLMLYVTVVPKTVMPRDALNKSWRIYGACFCILGVAALVFSSRITFSGARFAEVYGDGNLRSTYEFAFCNRRPDGARINENALYLLRRFDLRLIRKQER